LGLRVLSVRMCSDLLEELDSISIKVRRSRSELIRYAVTKYGYRALSMGSYRCGDGTVIVSFKVSGAFLERLGGISRDAGVSMGEVVRRCVAMLVDDVHEGRLASPRWFGVRWVRIYV